MTGNDYLNELESIKKLDISPQEKDMKISGLMTEMEKRFMIPPIRNAEYEKSNPEVMRIYRTLSYARETI